MTLDPKAQFRKSPVCKAHIELVAMEGVHESLHTALAHYALKMQSYPDMATAAAQAWRLQGAKEFIDIWLNLGESTQVRKPEQNQNLQRT